MSLALALCFVSTLVLGSAAAQRILRIPVLAIARANVVGDVDRDGHPDIGIGAANPSLSAGEVRVFSGKSGKLLFRVAGSKAGEYFGTELASPGDVNGDSHDDILVSGFGDSTGIGVIRLISGKDQKILKTWKGTVAGLTIGRSLVGLGDVDQDGVPDFAMGAHDLCCGSKRAGYVEIWSGKKLTRIRTLTLASKNGDGFGTRLARSGDLDGDRVDDLIVMAPFSMTNGYTPGSVEVYSGKTGKHLLKIVGPGYWRRAYDIAALGDVDRDGAPDLVVAYSGVGPAADAVIVYSGKTGKEIHRRWNLLSREVGFVFSAGDVDRDGRADFGYSDGVNQVVHVVSGLTGRDLQTLPCQIAQYGSMVGNVDFNLDGRIDVLVPTRSDVSVYTATPQSLLADRFYESTNHRIGQKLALDAGVRNAGQQYWLFGSASGSTPGVKIGPWLVPLNPDPYTDLTFQMANRAPFINSRGVLDVKGMVTLKLQVPALKYFLTGSTYHHAAIVFDKAGRIRLVTNAVPVTLVR